MQSTNIDEKITNTETTIVSPEGMRDRDETIPYRIVGTYEYDRAVKLFTSLVGQSSSEEIKIYDKILQERSEFTFLNGVATAFNQRPDLAKATETDRERFNDKFKRKGLAWMMALAKVELGATLSLYGESRFPFNDLNVTEFEAKPMLSLLKDDVVAHMNSLAQEPLFKKVMSRKHFPNSDTVAYIRRLKLIKDMLGTLARSGDPAVASAIAPYQEKLKKHEKFLVAQVMSQEKSGFVDVASATAIQNRDVISSRRLVGECEYFIRSGQIPSGQ